MKQSFKNHTRWYVPHHFVYYPILLLLIGYAIYNAVTSGDTEIWIMISVILLFLFWLAFMLRQHYALTLQDRLAKTELRYRYFSLTGQRLEQFESDLPMPNCWPCGLPAMESWLRWLSAAWLKI